MKRRHFFSAVLGIIAAPFVEKLKPRKPAVIRFQLDMQTMGRMMTEDINRMIRQQGLLKK